MLRNFGVKIGLEDLRDVDFPEVHQLKEGEWNAGLGLTSVQTHYPSAHPWWRTTEINVDANGQYSASGIYYLEIAK